MVPAANEVGEAAVRFIAPYVPIFFHKLGEGALKKAGADAFDAAKGLYQQIWKKAETDEATRDALAQLAEAPENEKYQQVLQERLIALLEREKAFNQALVEKLVAAGQLTVRRDISAESLSKSVAVSGDKNTINQTFNDYGTRAEPKPKRTGKASNVPSGSSTFVGRDEVLASLHERLSQRETVAITAIQGMGGIGKTELARQYAQRHGADYPGGVCWVQARELDVASQIVTFAQVYLGLEPPEGVELPDQVAYCWSHWPKAKTDRSETKTGGPEAEAGDTAANETSHGNVLVVYDDVTDYQRVAAVLPPEDGRFRVLMTTRRQHLATTVEPFEIELLSEDSALALLKQIVGEARVTDELETAKAICEWVGNLPLGLELVGQYLKQKPDVTFTKLQQRLEAQRIGARALKKAHDGMTAKLGVTAAFELSWETLSEEEQQIACWMSLFALAPIPWELAELPLEDTKKEDFEDGRDQLVKLSLLQRVESGTYQLHQLVREYFLAKLTQREEAETLKQVYGRVMVAKSSQIPKTLTRKLWIDLTPMMPHIAEAATEWQCHLNNEDVDWPFIAMARFYAEQGAYAQAEPWYQKGLVVTQRRLGEAHPIVAANLNNLASLYRNQGRYEDAEPLFLQALKLMRKQLGEAHPAVATSLQNLAAIYNSQGRYEDAEPLVLRTLEMRRELFGEAHPAVANSLHNLAYLYDNQGRYGDAEPLHLQALKMRHELLGETHLDIANSLNNLALLYEHQGRHEDAEPLHLQALEMRRELLGETHPSVANSLNNLATLYSSKSRYEEAEPLYLQAIAILRDCLGDDHPNIRTSKHNFYLLVKAALATGQQDKLSDQPITQKLLEIVKDEQKNTAQ